MYYWVIRRIDIRWDTFFTKVTLPSGPCESSLIQVGSCYPHSKTASRSTSRGCFLFKLPFLHRAGLLRKDRGAGLARIRIWGGRQRRLYHKCETCDNSRTLFISEKTDFIFSKEYDILNEVENDLFYYIEISYNRKRSTHMGIGTHYKNTYQSNPWGVNGEQTFEVFMKHVAYKSQFDCLWDRLFGGWMTLQFVAVINN